MVVWRRELMELGFVVGMREHVKCEEEKREGCVGMFGGDVYLSGVMITHERNFGLSAFLGPIQFRLPLKFNSVTFITLRNIIFMFQIKNHPSFFLKKIWIYHLEKVKRSFCWKMTFWLENIIFSILEIIVTVTSNLF